MDTVIRKQIHKLIHFFDTNDPFRIAKGLGIIIVRYPLHGIRGFYHYFQRNHIIYIDERLTDHEARLVCAHELGHMLLHKSSNAVFMNTKTHFNTTKYEIEADSFAMNLLVRDEVILENIHLSTNQFSRLLGYEEKLLELRLKNFRNI